MQIDLQQLDTLEQQDNKKKIKATHLINKELYKGFKQACIELETTMSAEIEDSIARKLKLWRVDDVSDPSKTEEPQTEN